MIHLFVLFVSALSQQFIISNNTQVFDTWKDFKGSIITFELYFFNITNSEDILSHGAKPYLAQVGPFTYSLTQNKTHIKYSNDTVSFREVKTWKFIRHLSSHDDTVKITTVNTPLVITLSVFEKLSPVVKFAVEEIVESLFDGYFIQRSVKELAFDGYPDRLMKLAPIFLPEARKYKGKFAYFFNQNMTDDGLFTVFTGKNNISSLNLIHLINGKPQINTWISSACNSFEGSIKGGLSPPSFKIFPTVKIYNSDICRTLTLSYRESHKIFYGLSTWRYGLDESNFQNSYDYPFNSGYGSSLEPFNLSNLNESFEPGVYPSGIFDISRCRLNAPFFISLPNFLHAHPYYLTTVIGLKPNASINDFWIEYEPITGGNVWGQAPIQLNVALYKPTHFGKYKHIPNIVLPIFWQKFSFTADQDVVEEIRYLNTILYFVPHVMLYILFSCSIIIFSGSISVLVFRKNEKLVNLVNTTKTGLLKTPKVCIVSFILLSLVYNN